MAQHIAEMIHRGNPEAIEKYVKNHLPSDTASLERIYKQLLEYNPAGQAKKASKMPTKSQSVSSLSHKHKVIGKKEEMIPVEKKRTQNLIKLLREKGFKPTNADEQQGLNKFKSHKQRLTKPHITNSKLLRSQQAVIDRLINRYVINSKYYNNEIEDVKIDFDKFLDPDMCEFMERRNSILESFKNKTNNDQTSYSKFSSVTCRVYERLTSRNSFEKMPSMKDTASTLRRLSPTKKIMQECTDEIKQQKFKEVKPTENYYLQVKQKIQRQFQDGDDQNTEDISNFKQKLSKLQFQRYTNSYMQMMNNKIKEGSKCKLSNYAKDLLRDERKMRNIIDFSNK